MPLPAEDAIAVMGATGSGKSSFIRGITGSENAKVGLGLRSETSEIQTFKLQTPSGTITLVDTPGFDDTERTDFEIMQQLVDWVQKHAASTSGGLKLAGILFLHPITHNRLQGSNRRMLSTFKKLLGDDYLKKVLLVTTFWNDVQVSVGEQRERELMESTDAWKPMIAAGAQTERMSRDYNRFIPLLEAITASSAPRLLVQVELNQGKSLEETTAGLSLDRLHIEQDHRLAELKAMMNTPPIPCDDGKTIPASASKKKGGDTTSAVWKARQNLYQGEIEAQRLENDRIMAQIQEQDSRQDALRQEKRRKLEEAKAIEQEFREARRREQQQEEARRLKTAYETVAELQLRASRHLETHVCEVIDSIRAYSAGELLPVSVDGIQQEGLGLFGDGGARGRDESVYSVTRSGLNIWCDGCLMPIGAKVRFVCCSCGTGYCETCNSVGRGCLNRDHALVRDDSLEGDMTGCQRLRWPTVSLVCDGVGCGAQIEGFYFHCCCDGLELDFCRHCVLQREQGCPDDHVHEWGVRPILTPGFSTESMERQLLGDLPQQIVTGDLFSAWMGPFDNPSRLSTSVMLYNRILAERQKVQEALEKGEVMVKIELGFPGYCDFCFQVIDHNKHYFCASEHPETGGYSLALCEQCWESGLTCPSRHDMFVRDGNPTKCPRIVNGPSKLGLYCNICEEGIYDGVYFHCCDCNEDYDLCPRCILAGMGCEKSHDGEHTMKLLYMPLDSSGT